MLALPLVDLPKEAYSGKNAYENGFQPTTFQSFQVGTLSRGNPHGKSKLVSTELISAVALPMSKPRIYSRFPKIEIDLRFG